MEQSYDVVIVGGGPGGCTAALYSTRAGLSTIVVEQLSAGGQMALTTQIDNYPGFADGIDGFVLGEKMRDGAERFGARIEIAKVQSLDLTADNKMIKTDKEIFYGRTVILATGATPRVLGVAGEKELAGRGVNYCAACDGMFYKGKTVVVVGGGNTAVADALLLSRICKEVILVHRRQTLRATKIYQEPLLKAENIKIKWNSQVTQLLYDVRLTGVKIQNVNTKEETIIKADGIFVSVGRTPATELVRGQIDLDDAGYIKADESTRTNIPGVFAVGDVRTKVLRQIVTAVADGAMASYYAEQYLEKNKK